MQKRTKLLSVNKLGLSIYTSHNYCKKKKRNTLQVVGSVTSNMWAPGSAGNKRRNRVAGAHTAGFPGSADNQTENPRLASGFSIERCILKSNLIITK